MLIRGQQLPLIYETETEYWVSNGYIAFAFDKRDFIFNPVIFKPLDMSTLIDGLQRKTYKQVKISSFKEEKNKIIAQLIGEDELKVYASKNYIDMFSDGCTFYAAGAINPIKIENMYGKLCGAMVPIRYEKEW